MTTPLPLPQIDSTTWEHPLDRAALQALRKIPGFDLAIRKVMGLFAERTLRLMFLGSSVEVGPEQYPQINRLYEEVLATLDAPERYQLFVSQTPFVNAGAVGWDKPFIVLNSSLIKLMPEQELRYIIGHELGHILSGHVLYKTMLKLLIQLSRLALSNPLSGFAYLAVVAGLMEWDRKSELSADRAGLLVVQDPDVVRKSLLIMAGGLEEGASVEAFRAQARRYEEDGTALDAIAKTLALLGQSHPFPVQRIKELDAWIEAGEYQKVLDGTYPRRGEGGGAGPSMWEDVKHSAGEYAGGFQKTADRVADGVIGAGQAAAGMASGLLGKLSSKLRDNPDRDPPT